MQRSGALSHIRVLDLTRVRAGPTSTRILADFGADVIRVEPPPGVDPNEGMTGDRHSYDNLNLHRNKRSLTLNLKTEAGLALFKRLVPTADVVVENFRPDVKDRLGIGYESLKAINPRIILASISGFGQSGPYRTRAGFDQIAQGMGGLMYVTGRPGEGPMRAGIAVADSSAGIYAATGILIALAERERSGVGQWIHTSLLEAQIAVCDFQAALYLIDGKTPQQAGNDHPYVTPMGVFPTSDGFINIGVAGDGHWRIFAGKVLERPDLSDDPDFATLKDRSERRPRLNAIVAEAMRARPTSYWLERLEAEGLPAGPIYRMPEVFADPHVQSLGMAVPLEHPVRGEIRVVGQPVTLSRTPARIETAAPDAGQHTAEILADLGLDEAQIASLRDGKVI